MLEKCFPGEFYGYTLLWVYSSRKIFYKKKMPCQRNILLEHSREKYSVRETLLERSSASEPLTPSLCNNREHTLCQRAWHILLIESQHILLIKSQHTLLTESHTLRGTAFELWSVHKKRFQKRFHRYIAAGPFSNQICTNDRPTISASS